MSNDAENPFMKIAKKHLRKGLPAIRYAEDGSCNVVLCLYRRRYHPDVCSPWQTSNTEFYRKNRKQYLGWIEISQPDHVLIREPNRTHPTKESP